MVQPISFRDRFLGLPHPVQGKYAPSTLGAPEFLNPIDYNVFKKTKEEKKEAKLVKQWHKDKLKEAYPGGIGKHLNIPSQSLSDKSIFV